MPLIEADETFAEMEHAIGEAEREVLMAYWTLAPHLELASDRQGSWEDLLSRAARRGVKFRILLADFDPVFTQHLHRNAWDTFHRLRGINRSDDKASGAVEVICSRNPARPNLAERLAGHVLTPFELRKVARRLNREAAGNAERAVAIEQSLPGLWHHLKRKGARFSVRFPRPVRALPGSHHEKLCIVDRTVAFAGGLDIGERRYDTADHEDDSPWHDLACRIEGPVVGNLLGHFIDRWNSEVEAFRRHVGTLPRRSADILDQSGKLSELHHAATGRHATDGQGDVAVAFSPVRTPRNGNGSPPDIATAVAETIRSARRFIYIESQYLREPAVVYWLTEAANRHPELEVILLLPLAPERLSPDGEWSRATRHGHWLQQRNVERLREALGARFGVFTLLSCQPSRPEDATEDTALGARSIYVHAKVVIADDRMAMIGSANLNGRSFRLDTETALVWKEGDAVRAFRERLWRHHLDSAMPDTFDPLTQSGLELWNKASERNSQAATDDRPGFCVAFEPAWLARNARRSRLIRNRFV
jgi:phosphatidylserine/phosphatidylglycerophosphate/cardiolipin synthase-like enzyme